MIVAGLRKHQSDTIFREVELGAFIFSVNTSDIYTSSGLTINVRQQFLEKAIYISLDLYHEQQ